jgi:hypothetical protein
MKRARVSILCMVLAAAIVAVSGCGSSSSGGKQAPPSAPSATTSGGLATINTGSLVIAFIPNGTGVSVVPIQQSGSTFTTASYGSLRTEALSPITITTSFNVNSCAADAPNLKIICVGYTDSKVAIIDVSGYLASGAAPTVTEYDLGNTITSSFSGGGCLDCGVLPDATDKGFIVSSGDGYRVVNYSGTVLKSFLSDPTATTPVDLSTENFGYDPINNRIYSPEYETTNNYLWVVDVTKGKNYRWNKKMVDTTTDPVNGLPELDGITSSLTADAVSVDPSTGLVTIGHEWIPLLLVINMNAAVFNDTTSTFDAPYAVIPLQNVYSPASLLTTGMVVEPSSHIMFLEEEFGDAIGAAQFPSTAAAGSVTITSYTSAQIPTPTTVCPTLPLWSNVGDPHGLSSFTAVIDGKPMGLLIDGSKVCMAIVDLNGLLAAPKGTGTSANQVSSTYDLLAHHIVNFISLQ